MNSRNRQTAVSATPDLKSDKNGSQAIPVISGWALFGRMPAFRRQPLETFSDLHKQFGDVVCFRGLWTSFMLTDPRAVEHVLQTNSRNCWKGRTFQVVKPSLGTGLFVIEGDFRLRQRRLMQPVFHKQRIG